ncbi:MAG TPA: DUF1572 family protein [Cytophagaceae bacterium]|jgi:uncharacterized damage-inducible protein DinB
MSSYLNSVIKQFAYYKTLGEKTFHQVPVEKLFCQFNENSNSIATIVNHLSGNMLSRWTDFLTTDGEKEWRNRDAEFDSPVFDKGEMIHRWDNGWKVFTDTLYSLKEEDLEKIIYIRNEGHTVLEAINRQLAHYSYHIGQIIYIGKMYSETWNSLSIPKGDSQKYNTGKFDGVKEIRHFTDGDLLEKDSQAQPDDLKNQTAYNTISNAVFFTKKLEILERTPDVLDALLEGLCPDWIMANEGENTWNAKEVLAHLIVCDQTNWMVRMKIILSQDAVRQLVPIDMTAHFELSKSRSLNDLLKQFRELRAHNLMELNILNLQEADFLKTARHPKLGEVNVQQLIATWATHDLSHITQISRVLAKLNKNDVGPFQLHLKILNT